jgi:hypothetical protein
MLRGMGAKVVGAVLACAEESLRGIAEEMAEQALRSGTKAERCRARESLKRMRRAGALEGGTL